MSVFSSSKYGIQVTAVSSTIDFQSNPSTTNAVSAMRGRHRIDDRIPVDTSRHKHWLSGKTDSPNAVDLIIRSVVEVNKLSFHLSVLCLFCFIFATSKLQRNSIRFARVFRYDARCHELWFHRQQKKKKRKFKQSMLVLKEQFRTPRTFIVVESILS